MKAEEEYSSLFEKEGSIEAPPSTKGVGGRFDLPVCHRRLGGF